MTWELCRVDFSRADRENGWINGCIAMTKVKTEDKAGVTVLRIEGNLTAADVLQIEPEFKASAYVPGRRLVIFIAAAGGGFGHNGKVWEDS